MTTCGRPTRKGTPCPMTLRGGKCPTHNSDLAKRNKAVRAAFAENNPAAYSAHQSRAGKRGFKAAGQKHDWAYVNERSRLWRLENPSEPERWALGVLDAAGLNHFVRELPVLEGHSLDFAWPDAKRAVEIDGKPSKASDEESAKRARRQAYKLEHLGADGWQILTIDATGDRAAAAVQLVEFARAAQPDAGASDGYVWSF